MAHARLVGENGSRGEHVVFMLLQRLHLVLFDDWTDFYRVGEEALVGLAHFLRELDRLFYIDISDGGGRVAYMAALKAQPNLVSSRTNEKLGAESGFLLEKIAWI